MILQALVDYYERKRALDPGAVAAEGWELREIAFFLDVAQDGTATLVDRRSIERKRGELLLVPAAEIRSGTDAWKQPNLLWDHMGFVLGLQKRRPDGSPDPADKPDKVAKQHRAFKARIADLAREHPDSCGLAVVMRFYERFEIEQLRPSDLRDAMLAGQGLNLTFRLQGEIEPVCHERWVAEVHSTPDPDTAQSSGAIVQAQCLITGAVSPIARLHPKVSFVTKKPSPLVAANTNEAPAYSSYGKAQAMNGPVSQSAASRYSLALNSLLRRNSPNRIQIGDATTVIWADRDDALPAEFAQLFGDDPDAHVANVRRRLDGVRSGSLGADDSGLRFFILGLAPNASRIAVRLWLHERFEVLAPRVLLHFDDLRIVGSRPDAPATPSMFRLLSALAPQGKVDKIPRLAGEWLRAILEGTPYPATLLNAAVNRCRAEQAAKDSRSGKPLQNVTFERAAILKACINRSHRARHALPADFQYIHEELDVNQDHPAYRLGRLFAVLERIQSPGPKASINATIRDRYYGAASSTPVTVFPTLLRLKNAHLKKLSDGQVTYFEKLIGEVCGSLEQPRLADFPRQLDLHAQGLFALGYYHQRQSFFSGKRDADDSTPDQEP